jgi:hypothetical protein
MMLRASLTARTFALSFASLCVVPAASFLALGALAGRSVKESLKRSLQESHELVFRPR